MRKPKDQQLSGVKALMLDLLKSGQWVTSETLLKKTGQKYFDRRLRELRDEQGYDLESGFLSGEPAWRLRSSKRNTPRPRSYLGKAGKDQLMQGWAGKCNLCGKSVKASGKPVFDHRVPLIRGGVGAEDNFQILCVECNNQKRSQCRGCEYECNKCYLAYPENYPAGVILRPLDKTLWQQVEAAARGQGVAVDDWVLDLIERHLKKVSAS